MPLSISGATSTDPLRVKRCLEWRSLRRKGIAVGQHMRRAFQLGASAGVGVGCGKADVRVRWALAKSEGQCDTIKIIALHADSMPARASKGLKNGIHNRSNLIKILASKNIIKPCFQVATSWMRLCRTLHNWPPRFQRGVNKKYPLAREVWCAAADSGLPTCAPNHFGGINRQLPLRYAPKSLSIKHLSAFCSRQLVRNIIGANRSLAFHAF